MKVKVCRTLLSQARGLMFSKKKNLLFVFKYPKHVDLHMIFVFFPVDAIYLDEYMNVLEIKHMRPFWPYYRSKNKVKFVLESTEKHNFVLGDKLFIKNNEVKKLKQD